MFPALSKSSYHEKVLWSFNGTDGRAPYTSLILGVLNGRFAV
jgi:hypothetical protein